MQYAHAHRLNPPPFTKMLDPPLRLHAESMMIVLNYVCSVVSLEFAYYSLIFPISIMQACSYDIHACGHFLDHFQGVCAKEADAEEENCQHCKRRSKDHQGYTITHSVLGTSVSMHLSQSVSRNSEQLQGLHYLRTYGDRARLC